VSDNPLESQVPQISQRLVESSALNIFAQFTCRVWHPTEKEHYAWSSSNLESFAIDESRKNFIADRVKLSLSEDLTTYTFTASINTKTVVDVRVFSMSQSHDR